MLTFSINKSSGDERYAALVWKTIQDNLGYFKKFNGERYEEAVHRTYELAIRKKNDAYDDILPYIKKVSRKILQEKRKESAFDMMNEDGDISPIFATLRDYIDTDNIGVNDSIREEFKTLYLMDEESFLRLKNLYIYNEVKEIPNLKDLKIKNPQMQESLYSLLQKYGAESVFSTLYHFFSELPMLIAERQTSLTKEVTLKQSNYTVLDKIPDTATIKDAKGKFYYIDKTTLLMVNANPDYFKWDIVGSSVSTCDILKIDISEYIADLYDQTFVDEGVSTKHVKWCGDKFKLTSPAGEIHLGIDREKFITLARVELVINLMMSNIGSVVALSPDYIYIKPLKTFQFDRIRVKFHDGRLKDLPISVHIKKRKGK